VTLSEVQRREVLSKVLQTIDRQFMGAEPDTARLRQEHESAIVESADSDQFEAAMTAMLKALGTSHVGFFHDSRPRAAGRVAIAATFMKTDTPDGPRWMFQDVHPGGAAARAGIRPGDVLLTIDGKDVIPPDGIPFQLGSAYTFTVRRPNGSTTEPTVEVPGSKEKKRPIVVPDQVVTATKLDDGTGVVRVSMFPGVLGMDVARDMSRAVAELAADRLIIDLRGNTGGGIGCLRLMSLMCPDRRGVGYSISRAVAKRGYDKERLPAFDRIPSSKLGVLPLALRFARAKRSIAVFTEALGAQRITGAWHSWSTSTRPALRRWWRRSPRSPASRPSWARRRPAGSWPRAGSRSASGTAWPCRWRRTTRGTGRTSKGRGVANQLLRAACHLGG
jgi:carboxyl-terminal processing protease